MPERDAGVYAGDEAGPELGTAVAGVVEDADDWTRWRLAAPWGELIEAVRVHLGEMRPMKDGVVDKGLVTRFVGCLKGGSVVGVGAEGASEGVGKVGQEGVYLIVGRETGPLPPKIPKVLQD